MRKIFNKYLIISIFISILFVSIGVEAAYSQNHIKDMDKLRNSMGAVGNKLPEMIKVTKNNEMRTLERVYEINTYALTTIEAYFKMIKVAVSAEGKINRDMVAVFNGWLQFISKYCKKDVLYLDEAIGEMKDPAIIEVIKAAKSNIRDLDEIASRAIKENENLVMKK